MNNDRAPLCSRRRHPLRRMLSRLFLWRRTPRRYEDRERLLPEARTVALTRATTTRGKRFPEVTLNHERRGP